MTRQYAISQTRYHYGRPTSRTLVVDDDGELLMFDSLADAKRWITTADVEIYLLELGEFSRPHYEAVQVGSSNYVCIYRDTFAG